MDSADRHGLLGAFLSGDLGSADAGLWDQHLLECEQCWRAVCEDRDGRAAAVLLRRPAPGGLADRVRFAVEVAAAGAAARSDARRGGRLRWLAAAGAAAGLAITLLVLLVPGGRDTTPAVVAAVARYAAALPLPRSGAGQGVTPVEVGRPVTVVVGGQRIVMRTWRLGRAEAVVAVSSEQFPVPPGARTQSGAGMAWSSRLGRLGLYCINGRMSELVAAPVPAAELAVLAARLPAP
jgi:hypothetical protein